MKTPYLDHVINKEVLNGVDQKDPVLTSQLSQTSVQCVYRMFVHGVVLVNNLSPEST